MARVTGILTLLPYSEIDPLDPETRAVRYLNELPPKRRNRISRQVDRGDYNNFLEVFVNEVAAELGMLYTVINGRGEFFKWMKSDPKDIEEIAPNTYKIDCTYSDTCDTNDSITALLLQDLLNTTT